MSTDRNSSATTGVTRLHTIADVADRLQVSSKTARRWIDAGDLVAHRLGRQLRISEQDLQFFIRSRREA